jgi:transposase
MPMLEGMIDHVIGVDTHRDTHAAAVLDPNGGVRARLEVTADQAGHARLLTVATQRAPGCRVWALEGAGSYGAGLASFLSAQGEWVVEIDRPKRPRGRTGDKATRWMRSGLAGKRSPVTSSPARAGVASGRRCACCTPPAASSCRSAPTRAATSRR